MILIEIPAESCAAVSGTWGFYVIAPVPLLNGNYAVNPAVINIPDLPSEIKNLLGSFDQKDFSESDFPVDEGDA